MLRELFRNLRAFRAYYETEQIDEITAPDGTVWSLWDVEYLYTEIYRLSPRQQQAIELCLIANVSERNAALLMGVSVTNPVASYATNGLRKLCALIEQGELPRFRVDADVEEAA